jgi:hypothetical protein
MNPLRLAASVSCIGVASALAASLATAAPKDKAPAAKPDKAEPKAKPDKAEPPEKAKPAEPAKATATPEPAAASVSTDATRDAGNQDAGQEWLAETGSSVLELRADLGALSRHFDYHQDVNDNLRDHGVSFAPLVGVRLRWYPGAHFTADSAANLGIVAEYEQSLLASSNTETDEDFDTVVRGYAIGARLRFPIASHEIAISGVYGRQEFKVDAGREPNAVAANGLAVDRDFVPDVTYGYVRPGLDARFAFGRIHAGLAFGYRAIHEIGELHSAEWFPQATAHAIDGSLTIGYELKPQLIVFGGMDFVRYALSMNSSVQDLVVARDVAGGAVDQTIAGRAGIEWRIDAPESASEEASSGRAQHAGAASSRY